MVHWRVVVHATLLRTIAMWERGLKGVAPPEAQGPTVGRRTRAARPEDGAFQPMRVDGPSLCSGPTIPDAWASQKLTYLRTTRYEPMARPGRTQAATMVL